MYPPNQTAYKYYVSSENPEIKKILKLLNLFIYKL